MSALTIELTQGYVATVDAEAYDRLTAGGKWRALPHGRTVYAVRTVRRADGTKTLERMHRVILPGAAMVDHVDGDGLNNTAANLRGATGAANQHNSRRPRHNTSGFKGVSWHKRDAKWRAYICVAGRQHSLGLHTTAHAAATAYDNAAREMHGEFASLNFPRLGERGALPASEHAPALAAA